MKEPIEDLAIRYVLGQLDSLERTAFETQLLADTGLTTLVRNIEAALDVRRSLLGLNVTPNGSSS